VSEIKTILDRAFLFDGNGHVHALENGVPSRLTLHPRTGRLVRERDLKWPDDYPAREVAQVLLMGETREHAYKRALELGRTDAAELLAPKAAP
jgi:hypothetical protein